MDAETQTQETENQEQAPPEQKLDNPAWHALTTYQEHLSINGAIATRFAPDVLEWAALPEYNPAGFANLRILVADDEQVRLLVDELPAKTPGWKRTLVAAETQVICAALEPFPDVAAQRLSMADVQAIMTLAEKAQLAPFLSRTLLMGEYWGVWQEGQLVAMAGEGLHLPGYCEIGAACTHPDFRGQGLATRLTGRVAAGILARGETPFLHCAEENEAARRVYQRLGFQPRRVMQVLTLQRL